MRIFRIALGTAIVLLASACTSMTQHVTVAKTPTIRNFAVAVQVASDGNSAQMDANLEEALIKEGLSLRPKLPAGTSVANNADLLVSYSDAWRWDIVMYMSGLSVRMYEAENGTLLALGQWTESKPHPFRGDKGVKEVMENLIKEMLTKLKSAAPASQ